MATTAARQQQRRRTAAQWASENPVLAAGELAVETDTGLVKVGAGTYNTLPYINAGTLTADDPSEVDLATVGNDTTIALLNTIARMPLHRAGQYYTSMNVSLSNAQGMTQNSMRLLRVWLSKGTLDRIGIEVMTAVASLICRLGVYADDSGLPNARIAEASSTADCSTTGVKDLTISATIPKNGWYWFAAVTQAAAGGAVRGPAAAQPQVAPLPIGTSAPSGSNSYQARTQTGVTGTLPATIGTLVEPAENFNMLIHYRYSSVG